MSVNSLKFLLFIFVIMKELLVLEAVILAKNLFEITQNPCIYNSTTHSWIFFSKTVFFLVSVIVTSDTLNQFLAWFFFIYLSSLLFKSPCNSVETVLKLDGISSESALPERSLRLTSDRAPWTWLTNSLHVATPCHTQTWKQGISHCLQHCKKCCKHNEIITGNSHGKKPGN